MRKSGFQITGSLLLILAAFFLITAGVSRYLETDSGNILIHDIDIESYEGFLYGARLFRPLQASSLNQRPAILLLPGKTGNRYTCDHIGMELARRGFIALTMEDFSQGMTGPAPSFETENMVDAGYTFLSTRTFSDNTRIGLAAFYAGAVKAAESKHFADFSSTVFITPPQAEFQQGFPDDTAVYAARYESDPDFILSDDSEYPISFFPAAHTGMLSDPAVIASMTEKFHEDLAIPNDSPFWFSASSQHAQLLLVLRFLLLPMLLLMCTFINVQITEKHGNAGIHFFFGILMPLIVFFAAEELMNLFLVSVRIGSPFGYLPRLSQVQNRFSTVPFLCVIAASVLGCLRISFGKIQLFPVDFLSAADLMICLLVFVPVLFGNPSGWLFSGITNQRWGLLIITVLSCFYSLLLRIPRNNKRSVITCGVITGLMYYIICCGFPAELFSFGGL